MQAEMEDERLKAILSADEVTGALEDIFGARITPTVLYQGKPYVYPREVSKYLGSNDLLQRDILIKVRCGEAAEAKTVLLARSWIAMAALDEKFRKSIDAKKMTIGHIIRKRRLAVAYRNLGLKEVGASKLAPAFDIDGKIRLIQRSRMILSESRPVILIHEYIPKSLTAHR